MYILQIIGVLLQNYKKKEMSHVHVYYIVVVLALTRIIKSVVTGQDPVSLELRNTSGKKTQTKKRWYTRISQLTQFISLREIYKSENGSQPTMCQVHIGAYVSLLAPGKTDYIACHPRKTTTYILRVAPITTHTPDRRKSIGKKETNKRNEDKGKGREGKEAKKRKKKG